MNIKTILEITAFFAIVILITKPMGIYIYRVLNGQKTVMSPALGRLESLLYGLSGINKDREQSWFEYLIALLIFHLFGFVLLFVIMLLQRYLPFNPQKLGHVEPLLALNTAVSFLTNTNWQSYTPEGTMSYFSQMAGLAVHNFLSASAGICVAAALMRGFARKEAGTIGNFWADTVRSTVYILLPAAIISAFILLSQGVPQNFNAYANAVTVEGKTQVIAQGPVASQEVIKELGTNGGGFFNANSSHPYENPTPLSNMLEMLLILLIPAGLIYSFGLFVNDRKQGWALFIAVAVILAGFTFISAWQESKTNPLIVKECGNAIAGAPSGNLEGKETRFGIAQSALFSMITTATSCGAVNNMHDSDMPVTGLLELFNMHLGELIFGGVGSGLYTLLLFALLTVFIAGLMVGRTPEYLGKKIGPQDMQLTVAAVLFSSVLILVMTAVVIFVPDALRSVSNPGPHGFSQLLYAYTSTAANNGSAFAGLNANTPYWNLTLALNMLLGRFVPMILVVKLAGNLAAKKITPVSSGTLPTNNLLFAALLAGIIIIVGGLTFFPALAIGPFAEHLFLMNGTGF
jgi:potassium-transporting ATPase potassium-binding subunit